MNNTLLAAFIQKPRFLYLHIFYDLASFINSNFRYSFGLLLPALVDHFKIGRAEVALTYSFLTLLQLGSGGTASKVLSLKKIGEKSSKKSSIKSSKSPQKVLKKSSKKSS